jgi:hypothetical protein
MSAAGGIGVAVGVPGVAVSVAVTVGAAVGVALAVGVAVHVAVSVGSGVAVMVGVGVAGEQAARSKINTVSATACHRISFTISHLLTLSIMSQSSCAACAP